MSSAILTLTNEQQLAIEKEMGVISEELVVSLADDKMLNIPFSELSNDLVIALSDTWTVS